MWSYSKILKKYDLIFNKFINYTLKASSRIKSEDEVKKIMRSLKTKPLITKYYGEAYHHVLINTFYINL